MGVASSYNSKLKVPLLVSILPVVFILIFLGGENRLFIPMLRFTIRNDWLRDKKSKRDGIKTPKLLSSFDLLAYEEKLAKSLKE